MPCKTCHGVSGDKNIIGNWQNRRPYSLRHALCALPFCRGAAAGENPADRDPKSWFLCFPHVSLSRFIPARTLRTRLY